jgi:hypothetical protein
MEKIKVKNKVPSVILYIFCFILFLLHFPFYSYSQDSDQCYEESPFPTIPGDFGNYFLWWEVLPNTIDPNSDELIAVGGHSPPFTWSVSGDGFSLKAPESYDPDNASQILVAAEEACGTAEVTVTDNFGIVIIGEVRCSNGRWGERIEGCIMAGEEGNGSGRLIKGKYRQTQEVYNLSDWNPHWGECPLDICDEQCATSRYCDSDYGCEPCLNLSLCKNAGYLERQCPPSCRAWCYCTTVLYYQEWLCPDEE